MNISDKLRSALRSGTLTCADVNRFLAEYLEGDLDEALRAHFETHLAACPNCETYLDQYRTTIALVQEGEQVQPPPELVERTLAFLRRHLDT